MASEHISGGAVDLSQVVEQPGSNNGNDGQPAGQMIDMPSVVFDLTDQTFETAMQLSQAVPVVVDLWAEWCGPCKTLGPVLDKVTREFQGRLVLAKVDVDANPGLAQAFNAQSIPTIVAIVAGQAVPLFQGAIPEAQVRERFQQLLALAQQQGLTGRVNAPDLDGGAQDAEQKVNPAHEAALQAIERGDYPAAIAEYERVLAQAPRDDEAKAALAQVKLLDRLSGASAEDIRSKAASEPRNLEAQFAVADLDVSGGHVEDAFLRLLDLFADSDDDVRDTIRERLLELFEVVGVADPRVTAARGRLASLLF